MGEVCGKGFSTGVGHLQTKLLLQTSAHQHYPREGGYVFTCVCLSVNRVRSNDQIFKKLMEWLDSIQCPFD